MICRIWLVYVVASGWTVVQDRAVTSSEPAASGPRRRRRRGFRPKGSPPARPVVDDATGTESVDPLQPLPTAIPVAIVDESASEVRDRGSGRGRGREAERGWRDLAGNTPSQVGVDGALRARDVARPESEHLERAEREVLVVRRQWQPPEGDAVIGGSR
jgi:hypothetical protein